MWKKILAVALRIIGYLICYYCKKFKRGCFRIPIPGLPELQPVCPDCSNKPQAGIVDESTAKP